MIFYKFFPSLDNIDIIACNITLSEERLLTIFILLFLSTFTTFILVYLIKQTTSSSSPTSQVVLDKLLLKSSRHVKVSQPGSYGLVHHESG